MLCVSIQNLGTENFESEGSSAVLSSGAVSYTLVSPERDVVIEPGSVDQICFDFGTPPTGYYTVTLHTPDGSSFYTDVHIGPYCSADADCPDVTVLSGNLLSVRDMYCNNGYCDVNSSRLYVCREENATNCEQITLDGTTYFCEAHGSETVWTVGPIEFTDDLNDNDCDGVVERMCNSCVSCTEEMNVIGPRVARSGLRVVIHLTSDLHPSSSDLVYAGDAQYWDSSPYVCVLAASGDSFPSGTIVLDGNGHDLVVSSATAIRVYGTDGVSIVHVSVAGDTGVAFDGARDVEFSDSVVSTKDIGVLFATLSSEISRVQISCDLDSGGTAILKYGLGEYLTIRDVTVNADCAGGFYALYFNNSTLEDMNVLAQRSYFFSPKYNSYIRARSANGLPICEPDLGYDSNASVHVDGACSGYVLNTRVADGNIHLFLEGHTVTGYGIGADSGNLIIYGPGEIVGNVAAIYSDEYLKSLVVDLSLGDVNLCGNRYTVFGSGPHLVCVNCGFGHHLIYSADEDVYEMVNCDPNCVMSC